MIFSMRPRYLTVRQRVFGRHTLDRRTAWKGSSGNHTEKGITWQDKVTNVAVLEKAGSLSMHLMLCKSRLRHVRRMKDGRIPKGLFYGELATGCRPIGRPALRFEDSCKLDLKLTGIETESWEALALDRNDWRHAVSIGVKRGEEKRILQLKEKVSAGVETVMQGSGC